MECGEPHLERQRLRRCGHSDLHPRGDGRDHHHRHVLRRGEHLALPLHQTRRCTPFQVNPSNGNRTLGINSAIDKRLQRYIAARLGPLPGWSINYGFDLHENDWVNADTPAGAAKLNDWAAFLHEQMGYDHLIGARVHEFPAQHNGTPLDQVYRSFATGGRPPDHPDYGKLDTDQPHGPLDYAELLGDTNPDTPTLYEERHTYLRWRDEPAAMTMDKTRRLRWWSAMAGGVGGWNGFYEEGAVYSDEGPYPNPEQLRTWLTFWEKQMTLDLEAANELTAGFAERQYASHSDSNGVVIVFGEDTAQITLNLAGFDMPFTAVLVDAMKEYTEIDLGEIAAINQVLDLSAHGVSDWAVVLTPVPEPGAAAVIGAAAMMTLAIRPKRRRS